MKIITLTLFFSWWIIEGNDVGKVVVCVVVATGILGKVVPYVLVLKPTPKDGNDGCWWVTIPPVRPKPSSFGRIDCNKEKNVTLTKAWNWFYYHNMVKFIVFS